MILILIFLVLALLCLVLISFTVTFATPLSTLCIEYNQNLYHRAVLPRTCHILIEPNSCPYFFLTGTVAAHIPSSLSICLALPASLFHSMSFVLRYTALKLYCDTACFCFRCEDVWPVAAAWCHTPNQSKSLISFIPSNDPFGSFWCKSRSHHTVCRMD